MNMLPPEVIERLIQRPEDLSDVVPNDIQTYKNRLLRLLEDYIADHDQQYLIELDGNKHHTLLFTELMMRLNCFVLRPAAVPQRLMDQEDDEVPEDVETDELMRMLAPKRMVAPRYRWRRSRWLRNCPVALAEGHLAPGKAEFSVSFLDKVYLLSDQEAMGKFLNNPRRYLLPPLPRPPCKLVITGPPLSGKTTLARRLADKYGAKVLVMDELIQARLAQEREQLMETARQEATENAIQNVKIKIRETEEAERLRREEQEAEEAAARAAAEAAEQADEEDRQAEEETEDQADNEGKDDVTEVTEQEDTEKDKDTVDDSNEDTATEQAAADQSTTEISAADSVDENHPEVRSIVELAVETARAQSINLPPEVYAEVMEESIKEAEAQHTASGAAGGWIFDGFPQTRDQWTALVEKGVLPDDVICLRDESESGDFLLKRWYSHNRQQVDEEIRQRQKKEEDAKRAKEEEARRIAEEEARLAAEEAERAAEEERRRRLEEGLDQEEGGEAQEAELTAPEADTGAADKQAPETPEKDETVDDVVTSTVPSEAAVQQSPPEIMVHQPDDDVEHTSLDESEPRDEDAESSAIVTDKAASSGGEEPELPPEGPELDAQREARKNFESEWTNIVAVIQGSSSLDPMLLEVAGRTEEGELEKRNEEELLNVAVENLEKPFQYSGWEQQGMDIDEEEEDAEADQGEQEGEEEEEEEESIDPNRNVKKPLGDVNYFCPVALQENFVLWPGNPEIAAKYRERLYYMSTNEARDKFLANPKSYLPYDQPLKTPPCRLFVLGPKGSGKSMHARQLAKKLGLFHIQFRERLQELIIKKTKKKVGPEYEEENQPEPQEEIEDDLDATLEGKAESEDQGMSKENLSLKDEEEEPVEFTDDEEAIKAYLENEDPLSDELMAKIINDWWNAEPFKSTGFILEGYPRTQDEVTFLAEKGLFPDAAILLAVEDSDIIGRLLPPKLEKWRARRDKKLAIKARKKERIAKKKEAAIAKRREELIKERDEKRAEKRADREAERGSEDEEDEEEVEEEEEEDNIDEILAEEFEEAEEEEEEEDEPEEDAVDRMTNELNEVYDNDTNRLATVQDRLEEFLIPRIEIDAGRKPHIVRYSISKKLKPRVCPLTATLASKMLQCGYKQPSRFGRWCPVKLSENDCIQPIEGPGHPLYPVIYRQHIYYLSSKAAREQFSADPRAFLSLPSPRPVVPMRMAILGPPKAGKTSLAKRFEEEYGLVRLSIGEAMRMVMETQPKTELVTSINNHVKKGLTVPDELAVQALEVALLDMRCQTRGYVLDGYPVTKRQVTLMTERSIIPVRVINLELEPKAVMVRATIDRYNTEKLPNIHDSARVMTIKLASWKKDIKEITEWYHKEHSNLMNIDADQSKWWVWNRALEINKTAIVQIQTYLQRIAEGHAASIADLCITPREFSQRLGDCGQYCPVSLALRGELVDCSTAAELTHAAEFRGHYYKMAGPRELERFLREPEQFVPPLAPRALPPPELLPRRPTGAEARAMFPKPIELKGYCPVTYLDGKRRYECIVPGDSELIVEYRDKLYAMLDEDKLHKFMRLPEKYWNLSLPHKLPPKKEPLSVTSLPMLGYMEQTVATAITKALTAVGNFKPKYPFLSPSRSAHLYVAYHLKAYNPRNSDYVRKKYKKKLLQYEETCELIRYLGDNMTKRFKEPQDRPIDFDNKMETFLQLKDKEPTTTWIA